MSEVEITRDWQQWVEHNLQRGCDIKDIVDILHENRFSSAQIKQLLGIPDAPQVSLAATAVDYDFQQSARRKFHLDPEMKLTRWDTPLLQLYTIDNFLDQQSCERLIALIDQDLRPSEVTYYNGDDDYRTSKSCFLNEQNDPLVYQLEEKISQTLGIQKSYSEPIQAQKYDVGEEFKQHTDYFEPGTREYEQFAGQMGQRTWTFLIYLNQTKKGGATRFVHLQQDFFPQTGKAVIWNNLKADGSPNPATQHHGMPVIAGKKYIITKWFRSRGQGNPFYT